MNLQTSIEFAHILWMERDHIKSQTAPEFTDMLRMHRHQMHSQTSYEFTDILWIRRHLRTSCEFADILWIRRHILWIHRRAFTDILGIRIRSANRKKSCELIDIARIHWHALDSNASTDILWILWILRHISEFKDASCEFAGILWFRRQLVNS